MISHGDAMAEIAVQHDLFLLNLITYAEQNDIGHEIMAGYITDFGGIDSNDYCDAVEDWNDSVDST